MGETQKSGSIASGTKASETNASENKVSDDRVSEDTMSQNKAMENEACERNTREEYLKAATVGELQRLEGTIHLAAYDPEWPAQFERLAQTIRSALGDKVLLLEHAGSTSVPGLSAKPIIDMVLAVPDSADEASYVPQLEAQGFVLKIREPDWYQHRVLKTPEADANLHVFSLGCEEIGRMLAFRDWLRTHGDDRRLYEETKKELAARRWKYVQNYADAKTEVVEEILRRALGSKR